MPEEPDPPQQPPPEQPTLLGNLAPDEMFVRGMQSVKMTSGTTGTWQPPTIEEAAQLFPDYEVLKLLGRGGMGAVYQARQIELDRLVAIKLLPLEISVDKDFADRFRREARAMAKLHHPNIITVFDFGKSAEGHLYFVMEYVEGANLYDIVHQVGLDGDQSLSIIEQVCTALAYAHGKGIVHRDIKPANVMIDTESHVKVADFGLARLTDASAVDLGHTVTGTVMGTPDYMAPEQMRGMDVDHRADIYSVGVMLYEMICREVPKGFFEKPSQRTGCDTRIDEIVIRAMHQAPDHRYQNTREMKAEVMTARQTAVGPAPASVAPAKPAPPAPPKPPGAAPQAPLPPSPKRAVMKAIPLPGAKKSQVPLFGGLAAGLIALIAGGIYLLAPKPETLTKAQQYAAQHAGTSTPLDKPGTDSAASSPLPSSTGSTAPSAPAGVGAFGGHRYEIMHGALTWDDARARAESLGGHLATLATNAEADWFAGTFGKLLDNNGSALWLGGVCDGKGQPWRWVTGEPWNQAHWHSGEPATTGGDTAVYVLEYVNLGGKVAWRSSAKSSKKMFYVVEWDDEKKAPGK